MSWTKEFDIQHNNNANISNEASVRTDVSENCCRLWYILRYKIMSPYKEDLLKSSSVEYFFPSRTVKISNEHTGKTVLKEKPLVPGYIFIHASLPEAKALSRKIDMPLWKKNADQDSFDEIMNSNKAEADIKKELSDFDAHRYVSVSSKSMAAFMKAVSLTSQDLTFLEASAIDLLKYDEVEFVGGSYAGIRGYLKTINGKSGGIVVVPFSCENDKQSEEGAETLRNEAMKALFYYGIPAKPEDIAIKAFAKGSRHAIDHIKRAKEVVDKMMQNVIEGDKLTPEQKMRLWGYAKRYCEVKGETHTQKANLAMLLYRIYTLLESEPMRQEKKDVIINEIEPAYQVRLHTICQRDKARMERTIKQYVDMRKQTDEAWAILYMKPKARIAL